jgi:hypothetical protein
VEDFLKGIFSFLKRKTDFLAKEGSDKVIAKLARQYQSKPKVCPTSRHVGRLVVVSDRRGIQSFLMSQ